MAKEPVLWARVILRCVQVYPMISLRSVLDYALFFRTTGRY